MTLPKIMVGRQRIKLYSIYVRYGNDDRTSRILVRQLVEQCDSRVVDVPMGFFVDQLIYFLFSIVDLSIVSLNFSPLLPLEYLYLSATIVLNKKSRVSTSRVRTLIIPDTPKSCSFQTKLHTRVSLQYSARTTNTFSSRFTGGFGGGETK